MAFSAGTQLGPFKIEQELGRGGMGVVWLARDDRLDRLVAIKALPEVVAKDPQRLGRLRVEARIVAQLNHPHIAQIHHLLDHDGSTYLILEYIAGSTLGERIHANGGGLDVLPALQLMAQVAAALEAAHTRGVVHRDLKPDNIRVTDDGTAKILDFGIALGAPVNRGIDARSLTVAADIAAPANDAGMVGTPGFMSPEQCRGEAVDSRADVFSFGCVLYECLTGHRAIPGSTAAELIAATLRDDPDFSRLPSNLPDGVSTVVRRCMGRTASSRPASMHDVRIVLEEAIGRPRPAPTPAPAGPPSPTNLPHQRDHFIGRGKELAELARILDRARLVTLTGSGGCGKTRLAAELGRRLLERFDGGVWLIELAPTADPKLVPSAIATVLGARDQVNKDATVCLSARIADSKCLLILDNCEHVLDAAGATSGALLDACRNLKIIATSREALGVRGEVAWRVPSLTVPGEHAQPRAQDRTPGSQSRPTPVAAPIEHLMACESVALFVDRAREVQPAFELNDANASAIASICRRLDGIPLAIELAAARISVLAPEQIESRLRERFKLLRSGRGKAERHQTLRAAIDWSWRMLGGDQQRVLRYLGVFAGGCDLDGATAVVEGQGADEFEVLDLLTHLAAKSLLLSEESRGQRRYRLLETVRQYALEELDRAGEASQALDRHLAYFADLVARAEPDIMGPNQASLLDRLDADADNLLTAIEHGCRSHPLRAQRMCGDTWRFWMTRGHLRAGLEACTNALAAGAAPTQERAAALTACMSMNLQLGDTEACSRIGQELLATSRELAYERGIGAALNTLGTVAHHRREFAEAKRLFTEALSIN
jgi:non-specific serine/threonine protein kinase